MEEQSDDDSSEEAEENELLAPKSKGKKRFSVLNSQNKGLLTPKRTDSSARGVKSDYSFLSDKKTLTPKVRKETDNRLKSVLEVREEDDVEYSASLSDDLQGQYEEPIVKTFQDDMLMKRKGQT